MEDPRRAAAEYVLGTLPPADRLEAQAWAERDPAFADLVRLWEQRFAPLHELSVPARPPPGLWDAILADLPPRRVREEPSAAPVASADPAPEVSDSGAEEEAGAAQDDSGSVTDNASPEPVPEQEQPPAVPGAGSVEEAAQPSAVSGEAPDTAPAEVQEGEGSAPSPAVSSPPASVAPSATDEGDMVPALPDEPALGAPPASNLPEESPAPAAVARDAALGETPAKERGGPEAAEPAEEAAGSGPAGEGISEEVPDSPAEAKPAPAPEDEDVPPSGEARSEALAPAGDAPKMQAGEQAEPPPASPSVPAEPEPHVPVLEKVGEPTASPVPPLESDQDAGQGPQSSTPGALRRWKVATGLFAVTAATLAAVLLYRETGDEPPLRHVAILEQGQTPSISLALEPAAGHVLVQRMAEPPGEGLTYRLWLVSHRFGTLALCVFEVEGRVHSPVLAGLSADGLKDGQLQVTLEPRGASGAVPIGKVVYFGRVLSP